MTGFIGLWCHYLVKLSSVLGTSSLDHHLMCGSITIYHNVITVIWLFLFRKLLEINSVFRDKVPVIRRFTGGGTVIVDTGTIFVTFLCNKDDVPAVQPYPRPIMSWSSFLYSKVFRSWWFYAPWEWYIDLTISAFSWTVENKSQVSSLFHPFSFFFFFLLNPI